MKKLFTAHPHSVGETYFGHFYYAVTSGLTMLVAGVVIIIHGIFPFLFKKMGSTLLLKLMTNYVQRMQRVDDRVLYLSNCIESRKQQDLKACNS